MLTVKPKITYKEITLILGIVIALLVAYTLSGNYQALQSSASDSHTTRIITPFSYEITVKTFADILNFLR